jgi:hypothetical protein
VRTFRDLDLCTEEVSITVEFGTYFGGLVTGLREASKRPSSSASSWLPRRCTGHGHESASDLVGVGGGSARRWLWGVLLIVTVGELPEPYEQIFRGCALLVAAAVVTWMLFWMRRQAAASKATSTPGWTA